MNDRLRSQVGAVLTNFFVMALEMRLYARI